MYTFDSCVSEVAMKRSSAKYVFLNCSTKLSMTEYSFSETAVLLQLYYR